MLRFALLASLAIGAHAQVAPTPSELTAYTGVFAAAAKGDAATIAKLASTGASVNAKDPRGRTPLHVAAFMKQRDAMKALVDTGADPNALDADRYDMVTIAAVADDPATLEAALKLGNRATNVTSRYDGTALIESIVLGDGGARHTATLDALVAAGANVNIADRQGLSPLHLAESRGYREMAEILKAAGAR